MMRSKQKRNRRALNARYSYLGTVLKDHYDSEQELLEATGLKLKTTWPAGVIEVLGEPYIIGTAGYIPTSGGLIKVATEDGIIRASALDLLNADRNLIGKKIQYNPAVYKYQPVP